MKKISFFLATFLILLPMKVSNLSAQTNLLPNGDFEAWTSGKPDKWAGVACNATLSQSTDAHGGSYALKVGAIASSNKRLASSDLNLLAGTYTVTFWAKGGQVRPGYAIVTNGTIAASGDYKYGDYANLQADEWTQVSYVFTLEAPTTVEIVIMNPRTNNTTGYTATDAIIDDMTLTTTDGGLGETTVVEYTEATIATLAAYTENKQNISLTLTNAKVVYIDGTTLYVREGENAIMFYGTGIDVPVYSLLNGTLKGNFELYNLIPEFKPNEDTNPKDIYVTNSTEPAEPVETTVAEILDMQHKCDLVILRGITVVKDGTKYYAFDGMNRVQFYKGIDMSSYANGMAYDVMGLFNNTYNNAPEIQPVHVIEKYGEKIDVNINGIIYELYSIYKTAIVQTGLNLMGEYDIPETIIYNNESYIVTSIGPDAFKNNTGITKIIIPNSVTSIGNSAFSGCTSLTSINIPNSVTRIGNSAFSGCTGLTNVILNSNDIVSKTYTSESNLSSIFGTQVTNYVIGEDVTAIGAYAFFNCTSLTNITIPNSVTSIGNYAFYHCTGLTNVILNSNDIVSKTYTSESNLSSIFGTQVTNYVIGDDVKSIGDYAFYGCSGLKDITIPQSLTSIGCSAFYGCSGLTALTLPESLTAIGSNAFTGCSQARLYVQKGGLVILLLWEKAYEGYNAATTERLTKPTLSVVNTTQCTATLSLVNKDDAYDYKVGESVVYNTNEIKLTGLKAQNTGTANLYAYCRTNDKWYEIGNCQYTTASISPTAQTTATGSSITLVPSYIQGDATVTSQTVTFNGETQDVEAGKAYFFSGLNPNKYYSITYTISADGYSYTYSTDVRCASLVMNTQHPKVINTGNVIVAAITNIDDTETNVGFEWRRTDWTDDFTSNSGGAYLYDGTMEGYIRNLNADKLWKYRPYYESSDGQRFYGDWVGIDPTDTSFFDPTVHTYSNINVQGNSASVKGYAMRGTDNITEQGFKYWKSTQHTRSFDGAKLMGADIPADAQTVVASGQVMTATLTGLDYETDYIYVAFVTTSEGETFYGEQQVFHTGIAPTGISEVIPDESASSEHNVVGYYNVHGQRLSEPQRGVNIIRYSDGTSKKVLIK